MKHYLKVPCIPLQEAKVSILQKELTLIGSKGRTRRLALFDSGASYSIIRRDIAEAIAVLEPLPDPENWIFETARKGDLIEAHDHVMLAFRFDDSEARFTDEFVVFDECTEEVVIGAVTLQKWHIKLDFEREEIVYRKTAEKLRLLSVGAV